MTDVAAACAPIAPTASAVPTAPAAPPLDRLDPRSRVLAAVGCAVAVTLIDAPAALGLLLGVALAAAWAARLPVASTARKLAAMDGFVAMSLVIVAFATPGAPLWSVADGWAITEPGAARALTILLKANAAALAMLALIGAAPPAQIGRALARLGAPSALVLLYLFTLRYLDVLEAEYRRMSVAMRARGFRLGCDRRSWSAVGMMIGMLMVRSLERSERIVSAMRCRGFDGRWLCLTEERAFGPHDRWFGLLSALVVALCCAVACW